ncbi:MAG: hypothetical protein ABI666_03060 [Ferruginibacter sp.]
MIKQNKLKLTFILAGVLFAGITITGCNNGDADKAAVKDSTTTVTTVVKNDSIPAKGDSLKLKGNEKPTPEKP